LATITVPSGGVASLAFAGIPSGYRHLQVRYFARNSAGSVRLRMQMNDNIGNNYSTHLLVGDGTGTPASFAGASQVQISAGAVMNATASIFSTAIVDVLDYATTSKNKTVRILSGVDYNGASGEIAFTSGSLLSTSAITSLKFYFDSGNLDQHTQFALYGVK
jgi:hypothetical protein